MKRNERLRERLDRRAKYREELEDAGGHRALHTQWRLEQRIRSLPEDRRCPRCNGLFIKHRAWVLLDWFEPFRAVCRGCYLLHKYRALHPSRGPMSMHQLHNFLRKLSKHVKKLVEKGGNT